MDFKTILIWLFFVHQCVAILDHQNSLSYEYLKECVRELKKPRLDEVVPLHYQHRYKELSCLDACVHKKLGIMVNGKINKTVLEFVARKIFKELDVVNPAKYSLMYYYCADKANEYKDECEINYQLALCFWDEVYHDNYRG